MNTALKKNINHPFETIIDLIDSQALKLADKVVYEYLKDGEVPESSLTFSALQTKVRTLAALIQQQCEPGDRILLLYPSGLDYIVAFFASIYAGCIAVPAYPPQNQRRDWERLQSILQDSEASLVLSTDTNVKGVQEWLESQTVADSVALLSTSAIEIDESLNAWQRPDVDASTIAFLQYSSGSTGTPKGVMVSHGNLLHNQYTIQQATQGDEQLTYVGWLPIYHDMGLICNVIQPLYCGSRLILLAPVHVIQKPFRWLKAISDYRAGISGGPNFIYELCADKISEEQKQELDLSSWTRAFNGAEPINHTTLSRFAEAFAACGFRYETLAPCYGLAENTLFVSAKPAFEAPITLNVDSTALQQDRVDTANLSDDKKETLTLVSSGSNTIDQDVVIVKPDSCKACLDREVGEIWISGDSVAQGYWRQPELSQQVFAARIAGQGDRNYMRTGDLGFFDQGQLYITGRIKDVIIVRGQNHYPQDIEASVQSVSGYFRNSGTAAFAIESGGEEKVVVVQELTPQGMRLKDKACLYSAVQQAKNTVVERHQLSLHDIVLVKFGALSRTTSGKIQRYLNRNRYLVQQFESLLSLLDQTDQYVLQAEESSYIPPTTALQKQLCAVCQDVLKIERVGIEDNFFELGGNSLLLMQMLGALQEEGLTVSVGQIFSAPTIVALAALLESGQGDPSSVFQVPENRIPADCTAITPEMLPLVDLSEKEIHWIASQVPGGVNNIQDIYPLGPLQEGIFFHHQSSVGHDPYVMSRLFSVKDKTAVDGLIKALQFIVERHDSLRTAVLWKELASPVQVVCREAKLPVTWLELGENENAREKMEALSDPQKQWFDITRAPLLRLKIVEDKESEQYLLLLQLHHVIIDHECLDIIHREMVAYQNDSVAELPPVVPYRTFVAEAKHKAGLDDAKTFFTDMLQGVDEPTFPFGLVEIKNGGVGILEKKQALDDTLAHNIRDISKRLKLSPASVFHAAWALVISACSARKDIVFGTVLSGRLQGTLGAESMVGVFINTLPLRVKLSDLNARQLVLSLHESLYDLVSHEQFPLVSAQACSDVSAEVPLFSAVLNYRNSVMTMEEKEQELSAAKIKLLDLKERTNYPFTLSVDDIIGKGFMTTVQVDPAIDINRIMAYLHQALSVLTKALLEESPAEVSDLSVVPAQEQEQQLNEWNPAATAFPQDKCIHELFEDHVAFTPDASALVFQAADGAEQCLSYRELNVRANQLAHFLKEKKSVQAGQIIGVCLERSPEMIIAILGSLKAGAAYMPMDPDYPEARLQYLLDDADVSLVITQQSLLEKTPVEATQALCLDESAIQDELKKCAENNLDITSLDVASDDLAYVIYTSGSTGKPKGVMLSHIGLSNLGLTQQQRFSVNNNSRILQFASIAFDAATWEWCMALTNGASLIVAEQAIIKSPERLSLLVKEQAVSHATLPPALLPLLSVKEWSSVKTLVVAGEACPQHLADIWAEGRQFVNAYGPSETTVCASMGEYVPGQDVLHIGQAINNTQLYILDADLKLVPMGASGELYIGGVALAQGYLHRKELSAERFIANPFYNAQDASSSQRLYKTGDLVRRLSDGNIEFVGRIDHQIKVRGFRIELGEIEQQLIHQDTVKEAVVLAGVDQSANKNILAYVVPDFSILNDAEKSQGLESERLSLWQDTFEETYTDIAENSDETADAFSLYGWNSSYTRQAIPDSEMENWLANTVARIQQLQPAKVLEIGCGSGLILNGVAPVAEHYVATDISQQTVDDLTKAIARTDLKERSIQVQQGQAMEFEKLPDVDFDTVILNSVVQYFPSQEYLFDVVQKAVSLISSTKDKCGQVFIGDVRDHSLLDAFHCSVQLYQLNASTAIYDCRERIQQKIDREHELVIAPQWFYSLQEQVPAVTHVQIIPKIDQARNELSAYRYDVVLSVGEKEIASPELDWINCRDNSAWSFIKQQIDKNESSVLALKNISNAHVSESLIALSLLDKAATENRNKPISLINKQLPSEPVGITPYQLQEYCEQQGYRIELSAYPCEGRGEFHALITKEATAPVYNWLQLSAESQSKQSHTAALTNNPLQAIFLENLPRYLRQALSQDLPDYMLPAAITTISSMPLTSNGKIDRKALPVPHLVEHSVYQAPSTETEKILCSIWQDVLGVDRVGVSDNFFELGGHSLLAMQMISRLQKAGFTIDVQELFATSDLGELAVFLEERGAVPVYQAPENSITENGQSLSLDDLPLFDLVEGAELNQADLDKVIASVPGGVTNIQDIYPLAPTQEGILHHHRMTSGNDPYILASVLSVESVSRFESFLTTIQSIFARHDVLRTAVFWRGLSMPVQVVCRQVDVPVTYLDLPANTDVKAHMQSLCEPEKLWFDLEEEPFLKLHVAKDPKTDQHFILVKFHHIIADQVALDIIRQEILAHQKGEADLLLPAMHYREFVAQSLYRASHHNAEAFFTRQLADITEPTMPFAVGEARNANTGHSKAVNALPAELSEQLRRLSQQHKFSPAVMFHAAWALVVSACSGQDDLVFGTVLSGRLQGTQGAEHTLGMFINTLPLRVKLADKTADDLVHHLRDDLRNLLPYEQASLALAQRCSGVAAGAPLFSAIVNYRHSSADGLSVGDGETDFAEGITCLNAHTWTHYPFSLAVDDLGEGFSIEVQVDESIDAERIAAYVEGALTELAAALSQQKDTAVQQLRFLPETESQRYKAWNNTTIDYPALSIEQLFSKQAKEQPEKIAARFASESLTYQALDQESNQLAHLLQSQGIGPGDLVGICQRRSLRLLSSVLAVLKAGAAYVPLDPAYPAERIHYMIEDAGLSRVLADQSVIDSGLLAEHPSLAENCVMNIETVMNSLSQKEASLNTAAGEDDLAYMIYTSGSTGRPKGVEITRKNLTNFICGMNDLLQPNENDRLLAVTSLSFDIATLELYLPLTIGAEVVIGDEALSMDGERLKQTIADGITLMQATPVSWKLLLASEWQQTERFTALCGGEAFPVELAQALLEQPITLWNVYGPTETTVWSSAYEVSADNNPPLSNTVPIGRPIANTQLYVLDRHLQSVPVGVAGELFIGGDGVAQGYRGRADLTAERFIETEKGRLYRTGDLARYRADGVLECLGRLDNQVKVRGYRIELGEIEQCLMQHADVKGVVVNPCDRLGEPVLVAYILTEAEEEQHAHLQSALRDFVGEHLPGYMVPSVVVMIDEIPLTPNGKVDRKALPHPDMSTQQREYVAPRTETEEALCDIWQTVLDIERVGIHDNFFELGGHSLLATQLLARVNQHFQIDFPLRALFGLSTLEEFARAIDKHAPKMTSDTFDRMESLLAELEASEYEEA